MRVPLLVIVIFRLDEEILKRGAILREESEERRFLGGREIRRNEVNAILGKKIIKDKRKKRLNIKKGDLDTKRESGEVLGSEQRELFVVHDLVGDGVDHTSVEISKSGR